MKYHMEKFVPIKPINLDKVKKLEIEILREFVNFCEENHLKYFLAGGTLIGAVRHQGFVPWDDDMDVSMPRPDFEKFRELTKSGKLGPYTIQSIEHTPEVHVRPFDRIVNDGYMVKTTADQPYISPWLDVHALDGLPTDLTENKKHWDKANYLKRRSYMSRNFVSLTKNPIKRWLKWIAFFPYREIIGPVYYAKRLTEEGKKYSFYESEYIAAYVAGYGRKERMPRYYFTDGEKKLWFEGILCSVPPHYDLVLTHMYGEYMKLPAVNKRKTHMIEAWEIEKR